MNPVTAGYWKRDSVKAANPPYRKSVKDSVRSDSGYTTQIRTNNQYVTWSGAHFL